LLPLNEIERLAQLKDSEINDAKKVLATEATTLVHGRFAATQAAETARKTFEEGALAETLPTIYWSLETFQGGIGVLDAFQQSGLAKSTGEVRRAMANNAISVNDMKITTHTYQISVRDLTPRGAVKLSFGRKKHVLLKPK
jgi:tyrosyl-tRNA synthetase